MKVVLLRASYAVVLTAQFFFVAPTATIAADSPCPAMLSHEFSNLMDEPVSLCQFAGKVVLSVNTASECG